MKASLKQPYFCEHCESRFPKWLGKCPQCDSWNSIIELSDGEQNAKQYDTSHLFHLSDLKDVGPVKRDSMGIDFVDRLLGGGLPGGSAVLMAGQPGAGKSSLLFQIANKVSAEKRVLYVSAEESTRQLAQRFSQKQESKDFYILSEHRLEAIESVIQKIKPWFVVIDSIQMISSSESNLKAGGANVVRESAESLIGLCKANDCHLWIVGHVTKEGEIAGPRSLEHLVDTVMLFSLAEEPGIRLLQTQKHRFGASGEIAVLEMKKTKLKEIPSAQSFWLEEHGEKTIGCAYTACLMGSRVYCVEIQALCVNSNFSSPRRSANGLELNRLLLILAVLEKHLKIPFSQLDVYLNVVGGIKVSDPSVDFAIAAALVSAHSEVSIPSNQVFMGELGLTGEIRTPNFLEQRMQSLMSVGKDHFLSSKKIIQIDSKIDAKREGFSNIREAFISS